MHKKSSVVLIDQNSSTLNDLANALSSEGARVFTAIDPQEGMDIIYRERPRLVVTALVMPNLSGIEVLERVLNFDPTIDVVVITAYQSAETAVEAMRRGAVDYLPKPVPIDLLKARLQRQRDHSPDDGSHDANGFHGIIGSSQAMREVFARIQRVAPHFRTVLITGETGTGKELAARALHDEAKVRDGNFVTLNCSAVVETLFESELFGHVRGAFTGAACDKLGLVEYANNGTLFLDEIGDMPMATQAKLLRVLQNQEVLRVGSLQPRKVNVRIIAATNRDLRQAIAAKEFREDLYYRISMVEIRMPSLVSREGDFPVLVRHLIGKFSSQFGKHIVGLTSRAHFAIRRHAWRGNVRELENVIGHGCMMAAGDRIDVTDLPDYLRISPGQSSVVAAGPAESFSLGDQERCMLVDALEWSNGNQSQASRYLRIGRDALRYRMRKHGLLATA